MATIFEKLPASGDRCLILEPKEAYVQPFDLGDWTRVRFGFMGSYTSLGDSNANAVNENSSFSVANSLNGFYCGISTQNATPFRTGVFLGRCPPPNSTTVALADLFGYFIVGHLVVNTNNTSKGLSFNNDVTRVETGIFQNDQGFIFPQSATGNDFIAMANGLEIEITNKNTDRQGFSVRAFQPSLAINNNTSINYLKSFLANPPTSFSSYTGMMTTGFATGTGPLDIPNQIYINSPFEINRLRIHSILIEKYA